MTHLVRRTAGSVAAVADRRLTFEPKGELVEFRRDLRQACRTLVAGPGEILHAVYSSPDRSRCDLENVLTYNLGVGALAAAAVHGLVLERSFAGTGHRYHYATAPSATGWTHWRPDAALATLRFSAPRTAFTTPTAGGWWLHARRGAVVFATTRAAPPPAYLLEIAVRRPPGRRGSLLNLAKTLVDGVVSALHSHRGATDAVAARATTIDPGLSPAEFASLLTEPAATPLGPTLLVVPRAAGLQWLPADDQIVGLAVRPTHVGPPGEISVRAWTSAAAG